MDASIGIHGSALPDQTVGLALAKLEVAVHQKFPAEIQNYESHSETDGNYTVVMDLGEAAHVNCSVRSEFGNMILRSESQPAGVDEETLEEIGNELVSKLGNARMTAYDGILAVMKAVSFGNENPKSAERKIFNETMSFIQTLVRNQGMLAGKNEERVVIAEELGDDTAEDPFGFDEITDEDIQAMKTGKEPVDTKQREGHSRKETNEQEERERKVTMEKPDEIMKNHEVQEQPSTSDDISVKKDKTESELLLDGLLQEFETEQQKKTDAQSEIKSDERKGNNTDPLTQEDTYRGNDQFGLINKTREYQELAKSVLDQIHELLGNLYPPMYQIAVDLYDRNDQLAQNERNIQLKLDSLGSRQHELDLAEAELLASQQSLLQDRTKFNEYKESVRSVLSDYEVKCHLIKEQEDEIRLLKYDLSEQKKSVERYRKQIAQGTDAEASDLSKEKSSALITENESLKEQVIDLQGRVDQYRQIIETFRQCQQEWDAKEEDLKKQIDKKVDAAAEISALRQDLKTAKEQLSSTKRRADELEDQLRDAEKKEREQNERAETAEQRVKNLEDQLMEKKEKADALESQVKEAENKLAVYEQESDTARCATVIQQDLSSIGIHTSPVSGAAEMILEAEYEGCSIAVNVELSMIYVSKEIRKPGRYTRQVSDLNKLDIRTSYNLGDQEITCRSMYHKSGDVVSQVKDIMDAMKEFK